MKQSNTNKGDLGELSFTLECLKKDIRCSKPISSEYGYDLITDHKGILNRIQIKTTFSFDPKSKRYQANSKRNNGKIITTEDADYLVVFVSDFNVYYIIPVHKIKSVSVNLFPTVVNSYGKWEQYKEAWNLLKES